MKSLDFADNNWHTKLLWCAIVAAAACVLAFSIFETFFFSLAQVGVLLISIFVAALVSRYQINLPGTQITFAPKHLFAFLGIIWLHLPGGVLLAFAGSIASTAVGGESKKSRIAGAALDSAAAAVAAFAFYVALGVFGPPRITIIGPGLNIPNEIMFAAFAMAIAHLVVLATLESLFRSFSGFRLSPTSIDDVILLPAAGEAVNLFATIAMFLAFSHFGKGFGFVLVPLAILGHAAHQIHLRRLEQKTREITEASRIHMATVEALATAIDARDQVGVGHVRRAQIYALGVGRLLKLRENEIDALRTGALLHDIGKLAVPDHILNKPGRLTPAEVEKTKTHASVGASILETVGFSSPVIPAVKYHHEFWDGTGYPEGLKGNNIPLTARILSVADAFDTLRVARPYRPAVSREDACQFLRAGAGTQFDPAIVDLFLRNLRSFEDQIEQQGLAYDRDAAALRGSTSAYEATADTNYVEQIKRANREVFTLYSLARDFSSAMTPVETMSLFTGKVREFVPFDTCLVYLLEDDGVKATAVHAHGLNEKALIGKTCVMGEGVTGFVLQKAKPVTQVEPALDFTSSHVEFANDYRAMASVPLIADEKLIGAISLYSGELAEYQDEHLRLLETVSRIAADAIQKSLQHAVTENHALTDPMTGLPNARSLQLHFDREVKRSERAGNLFHVLVLDLDGFKAVNDTFGHKAGDKMLQELSAVIGGQLREYDFLARYGGDEFVAVIPDTNGADIRDVVARIEGAVDSFLLPVGDAFAKVGVSIGAACYPANGETFDQIVVAADKAMYLAKSFHKDRSRNPGGELPFPTDPTSPDPKNFNEIIDTERPEAGRQPFMPQDGLIVELDESHIVASAAIN